MTGAYLVYTADLFGTLLRFLAELVLFELAGDLHTTLDVRAESSVKST